MENDCLVVRAIMSKDGGGYTSQFHTCMIKHTSPIWPRSGTGIWLLGGSGKIRQSGKGGHSSHKCWLKYCKVMGLPLLELRIHDAGDLLRNGMINYQMWMIDLLVVFHFSLHKFALTAISAACMSSINIENIPQL